MNEFFKKKVAPLAISVCATLGISACSLSTESGEAHRTTELANEFTNNAFERVTETDFSGSYCRVSGNDNVLVVMKPDYDEESSALRSLKVERDEDSSSVIIDGKDSDGNLSFRHVVTTEARANSALIINDPLDTSIGTRGDSINVRGVASIDEMLRDTDEVVDEFLASC